MPAPACVSEGSRFEVGRIQMDGLRRLVAVGNRQDRTSAAPKSRRAGVPADLQLAGRIDGAQFNAGLRLGRGGLAGLTLYRERPEFLPMLIGQISACAKCQAEY